MRMKLQPRLLILAAALVVVACVEVAVGPDVPNVQFSGNDCEPVCDTLPDDLWNDIKADIDMLEWNEDEGIAACDTILQSLQALNKDDVGTYVPETPTEMGQHDPNGHGVDGQHIGVRVAVAHLEYYASSYRMRVLFHETAHHLGWLEHAARSGLSGAIQAGDENGTCVNW